MMAFLSQLAVTSTKGMVNDLVTESRDFVVYEYAFYVTWPDKA
jgi:hypothetical protein